MDMKLFVGPLVHSVSREQVTIIEKAVIAVKNGKIEAVEEVRDDAQVAGLVAKFCPDEPVHYLTDTQFLMPGLIDTHTHASQFPNIGYGYDKPLLAWLTSYTFPLESRYHDEEYASHEYEQAVRRTLERGTTTAVYFATVHRSSALLAEAAHRAGQRALVGKVNMDRCCPPGLVEATDTSVMDTEAFIQSVNRLNSELVKPIVSPRFAITCTAPLLKQLGQLAEKYDLYIQTHLSENKEEVAEVRRQFPASAHYTDVYDQAKLLTRKTILAHCVHLEDAEVDLLKARGCSVAHCPDSNLNLVSGLCDVRRLLTAGVNVALGTDVSGGSSFSIIQAIQRTLNTSTCLAFNRPGYKPLNYHEAFFLATMGGAIALNLEDKLGNFSVGKYFDAVVVDTGESRQTNLLQSFQKFLYTGENRHIHQVYVNGKLVQGSL